MTFSEPCTTDLTIFKKKEKVDYIVIMMAAEYQFFVKSQFSLDFFIFQRCFKLITRIGLQLVKWAFNIAFGVHLGLRISRDLRNLQRQKKNKTTEQKKKEE